MNSDRKGLCAIYKKDRFGTYSYFGLVLVDSSNGNIIGTTVNGGTALEMDEISSIVESPLSTKTISFRNKKLNSSILGAAVGNSSSNISVERRTEYLCYPIPLANNKFIKFFDNKLEFTFNTEDKAKLVEDFIEMFKIIIIETSKLFAGSKIELNGLLSTKPIKINFSKSKDVSANSLQFDDFAILRLINDPYWFAFVEILLENINKDGMSHLKIMEIKYELQEIVETLKEEEDFEEDGTFISENEINEIIASTKEMVVGQERAIEAIAYNIYSNKRLTELPDKSLIKTQKATILLDGPTGTGKTAIIEILTDKLSLPVAIVDAQSFSSVGYIGASLTDILVKLLDICHGDIAKAEKGVICIDEFDKLATTGNVSELIMRKSVQQELLAFIGGSKYQFTYQSKNIEFDTSQITFICMGAFTDLRELKIKENEQKNNRSPLGFNNPRSSELEYDKSYIITSDDYIKYGLERELIGRMSLFVSTKGYTKEDLKRILMESKISPLKEFEDYCDIFGVTLTYEEELIDKVVEKALEMNTGARALNTIFQSIKNIYIGDIVTNNVYEIHLTTSLLDEIDNYMVRRY